MSNRAKERRGAPSAEPAAAAAPVDFSAPRVGRLVGLDPDGGLRVDFDGNEAGPQCARSTVPLSADEAGQAVAGGREALLLFEGGDPRRPIVVGLLQPQSATPNLDLILEPAPREEAAAEERQVAAVDGKRVVLEGEDEVVLRCGKASITLRRNGKVVIRGTYLVSRADGTNRIKGGSVQIN